MVSIDRNHKPIFDAKAAAPGRQASQAAFLAAVQKTASNPAASREEVDLIAKLRSDIMDTRAPEKRWDLVLEQVKPFLDGQPPSERQATVQRLLDAFKAPPGGAPGTTSAELRSSWVRQGIEGAAALLGLTTDPAEMARREQEEQFAASIFARGNRLEHHPDEAGDDPAAIAKDIRAFLGGPAGGGPGAEKKWTVLNRLYERDWVDAGPVMVAIEKIAAEDFHRELVPSQHRGPGAYEAAQSIYDKATPQGGRDIDKETRGIPNQQYQDLKIRSQHASPEVQAKLAEMLSKPHRSLSTVSAFVALPLRVGGGSPEDGASKMFSRLEELTRDMGRPLATQVVDQAVTELEEKGGLPEKLDLKGGAVATIIERIKGTKAGKDVIDRMEKRGIVA